MYYLANFKRKTRKDKGRKRRIGANLARKDTQKVLSSVNRTSEELRGWTNTAMRLKRMIDGNF